MKKLKMCKRKHLTSSLLVCKYLERWKDFHFDFALSYYLNVSISKLVSERQCLYSTLVSCLQEFKSRCCHRWCVNSMVFILQNRNILINEASIKDLTKLVKG